MYTPHAKIKIVMMQLEILQCMRSKENHGLVFPVLYHELSSLFPSDRFAEAFTWLIVDKAVIKEQRPLYATAYITDVLYYVNYKKLRRHVLWRRMTFRKPKTLWWN